MLNTLAKPLTSKRKDNWIAHYGILLVFLLSLVGSIQDIERNAIIPFIPISFIVILIVFTFLILLLTKIKIKNIKSPLFIGLNIFGIRSEEHTSELQSRFDLVCRLLLE